MTFVLLCCFVVCSRRAAGFPERHLRPCLLRPPEHRGRHRYGQERRGVHQADARLVRGEGGGTRVRGPTMPRQGANTARMPAAPSAGPSSGVTGGGQAFSKNRANKRFGKSIRSGHRRANRFVSSAAVGETPSKDLGSAWRAAHAAVRAATAPPSWRQAPDQLCSESTAEASGAGGWAPATHRPVISR